MLPLLIMLRNAARYCRVLADIARISSLRIAFRGPPRLRYDDVQGSGQFIRPSS
jgi:hypothetical protein